MLTLYYKPSCPFCHRVLDEVNEMGIQMTLKDISGDAVLATELISVGGKRQVPFLIDADRGVQMYESGDIVGYLQEHYKKSSATKFDEACESCQ